MGSVMYPIFRTEYPDNSPPVLVVQWGVESSPERYCGGSTCKGGCGLPALVLQAHGREWKAYSSVVAHGPVWQPWRVTWTGAKVEVPAEYAAAESTLRRTWI